MSHEATINCATNRIVVKVGIIETDVFNAKAWHAKCMNAGCNWESKRYDRLKQAQSLAQKHIDSHNISN